MSLLNTRLRRLMRSLGRLALWLFLLCLTLLAGYTLYAVSALPPLQPWHQERLQQEFSASRHADLDFEGYLKREALLFEELAAKQAQWRAERAGKKGKALDAAWVDSRFNPKSQLMRLVDGAPYNRSFRLSPPKPKGQALLIHGLTDSPYVMKALAETLRAEGLAVTVLRLPGHGTLPSMMLDMRLADWQAAVRIAARDVAGRAGPQQPFYIGGFSTGGALALLYSLETLKDPALRRPSRVLLAAPAISLPPVAELAEVVDVLSALPVPALQKVRWQELVAEYDPYKFNSFPFNAAREVNRATQALQRELAAAEQAGRLAQMPPVLCWQSVVDATVGAEGVLDELYTRLPGAQHRLVLFDVNRQAYLRSILRSESQALLDRALAGPRGFTLDIVGNGASQGAEVQAQRWAPTAREPEWLVGPKNALTWPPSLALPGSSGLVAAAGRPCLWLRAWQRASRHPQHWLLVFARRERRRQHRVGLLEPPAQQPFLVLDPGRCGRHGGTGPGCDGALSP